MGILKSRSNKKYSYTPRFYKNEREGSPFQIEPKFDRFRKTTGTNKSLKGKFENAWDDLRNNSDKHTNRLILIIIGILLFLFLYIIDFDLSIFTQPF